MIGGFSLAATARSFLALTFILIGGVSLASGQSTPPAAATSTCHPSDWRVLSPSVIAIQCNEKDVSSLHLQSATVSKVTQTAITQFANTSAPDPVRGDRKWLSLRLMNSQKLEPNQQYRLFLDPGNSIVFDFDTNETISLAPPLAKSRPPNEYALTSKLGFLGDQAPGAPLDCAFAFQDASGKKADLKSTCSYMNNVSTALQNSDDIAAQLANQQGLEQVGEVTIDLAQSPLGRAFLHQLPVGIEGLSDIFGRPLKLDPKSKFIAQQAPDTKAASEYYINASYGAGVASKPAWILDAQFAPSLNSLPGGFQITPITASADIGENTISGQSFTDTIDIGSSASRVIPLRGILQEILFSPSITYETDRELDRHNLLAILDFRYNFAHLYQPQSIGSLQKFAKLTRDLPPNAPIPPQFQPGNIKPPLFGYALDFHTGAELGGALVDTTVTSTTGTATLPLPSYNIARVVPQVHGLLQIWKFSVEETLTGRYLLATENTILQLPNGTLAPERLNNWKAYSTLSGAWKVDSAGHFGFTVSYKDGFAPPIFQRINTVVAGVVVKY